MPRLKVKGETKTLNICNKHIHNNTYSNWKNIIIMWMYTLYTIKTQPCLKDSYSTIGTTALDMVYINMFFLIIMLDILYVIMLCIFVILTPKILPHMTIVTINHIIHGRISPNGFIPYDCKCLTMYVILWRIYK